MAKRAAGLMGGLSAASSPRGPAEGTVAGEQQQQQQHQQQQQQVAAKAAAAPVATGAANAAAGVKKTLSKMFNPSSWSGDGTAATAAAPGSPGGGLIAAFRSIIPKSSNSSAGTADSSSRNASTSALDSPRWAPPQPEPGRKSVLLAVCPHLPPSMQRPEWCMDDYTIMQQLYTGYASTVYKALCHRSREVVVLKSYALSSICELYQHQIYREVRLHSSLQHENVIKLYAAFQEGDHVVMVQEFADGGDLFALLRKYGDRLSERVAVQMVLDPFLRVLQYLHTRGIAHRDIKPENILFTKATMCLKLADFGLAIDLRQERAVTRAGTLDYMAPEVLNCPFKSKPEENKEKAHLHYNNTVDSWAVGVLTFELLVGSPPFYDQNKMGTEERIRSGVPRFPSNMLTEGAKAFITAALCKDPLRRPTCLDMVHHPWIELYRARRSMRQINTSLPPPPAAAGAVVGAAATQPAAAAGALVTPAASSTVAPGALLASKKQQMMLHSMTHKAIGTASPLQRIEEKLGGGAPVPTAKAAAAELLRVMPSAASSPALVVPLGLHGLPLMAAREPQGVPIGSVLSRGNSSVQQQIAALSAFKTGSSNLSHMLSSNLQQHLPTGSAPREA